MAKELPYFKFEPSLWENGSIQLCGHEAQGVFINLCAMYWQRLGNLPYKLAVQKVCAGNATPLDSLYEEDIIKIIDGHICIDFLNEQLEEFDNVSKTNSENARLGWEKRRKEATVKRPHSDPNAIREEKRKGNKIRREESENPLTLGLPNDNFFLVIPKQIDQTKYRVNGSDGLKQLFETVGSKPPLFTDEKGYKFVRNNTGKVFNEFSHVYNAWNLFIKQV